MRLDKYRSKRDFQRTNEPEGDEGDEKLRIFVVQEHKSSHLHYDFRLSLDGVLKSWAVPKGVPEKKGLKRLAVQTEDHPIEYANFEGAIPEGNYGAGEVRIWDKGNYSLQERSDDKLVFSLEGQRLKGSYALIRFKGKEGKEGNWLMMKI
ncbi:MAG: DNA polymerase ligase N-terminal domain-containing protein [Methanomassiliicoccales archaeon]